MISNTMSVYYQAEDFNRVDNKIYGRLNANGNLLKGLLQYGRRKSLSVYVKDEIQYQAFLSEFCKATPADNQCTKAIFHGDLPELHQAAIHFRSDPMISKLIWSRGFLHPAAFSICGITRTISTLRIAEEIGQLLIGPTQPWDALICTSLAVKTAITELIRQWQDYFTQHKQFRVPCPIQLPIIPLGVHTHKVACLEAKTSLRKHFREQHQIGENDFVVLFFGRLFFYDKAHPVPMLLALQELANRAGNQTAIHFIQAGWFESDENREQYQQAANTFCPGINAILLSDINEQKKLEILSGADVFISLSDNIQESFGVTPLEAMANELPVIVSDWDGYKDTVRHGIDGFRIPSYLPPPGCGVDIGIGYVSAALKYSTYCGTTAQMTAIDIPQTIEALWQLYSSADLRKQMGAAGRSRVLSTYDWQHIIKQYDDLWDELAKRRLAIHPNQIKPITSIPLLADPFLTFRGFASETLRPDHQFSLSVCANETYALIHQNELASFGHLQRLPHPHILSMLDHLKVKSSQTANEMIEFCMSLDKNISSGIIARTIVYLLKYNVLQIIKPQA